MSLPLQLCLLGACLGAGAVSLGAGYLIATVVFFVIAAAVLSNAWRAHGWQIWHVDDILQSIEVLPIPIAIYDHKDRLIACNRIYKRHHPKVADSLDLMDRRIRPSYFDIVSEAMDQSLTPQQREQAIREWTKKQPRADGRLTERSFPHIGWLRVGKRRLPNGGSVRVAIDINDLKAREADLIEAVDHARRADDMKSNFFSKMTHELRTPLNGIIGMANIVLLTELDAKTKRNIEILRNSGMHLLDLVNRVLDFSKLNSHAANQKQVTFNIPDLVSEVLNEVQFSPHAEGLLLETEFDPNTAVDWYGSRTGLRQILTNLVGNAVKFTHRGGVAVHVAQYGETLQIDVIDTGIGIPDDKRKRIFEAFEQVDGDWTKPYGGTGLGLTICAEIADAMHGTIKVDSIPGKGTRFRLEVPMKPLSVLPEESVA